ncbi:MAG: hypothetical protein LPK45_10635 [Bacteroidota bacterium]|nr:hypothetical protein [Bacteroidota bacterium]MDX5431555.1 hypothetical protein [Bacteroidota bacterium]MDX5470276.1 hypothetical protein [Bacteroidota bacterium]
MYVLRSILLFACLPLLFSFEPLKPRFEIEIIQDEESMDIEEETVTLKKAPFSIRVKAYEMEGVFMNASFESNLFDLGKDGKIPDFAFMPSKTMSEESENTDKDLILSNGYYSYLGYNLQDNPPFNRFNRVEEGPGFYTGYLDVEKFYEKEKGEDLAIKKCKKDLFLFFVATTPDHKTEIARYRVKITWAK